MQWLLLAALASAPLSRAVPTPANGTHTTGFNPTENTTTAPYPTYQALTDFDYASFNLALHQEYLELDLFHYGLTLFSTEEWRAAGLSQADVDLIGFMANQETGHAQLLSNILGPGAAKSCQFNYSGAWTDVRSYLDFNQRITRIGESGVVGFLSKLNSQDSAQLLHQSISTESRQQMIFRQFTGSAPMPVWFESGIPQTWAWTLIAPYIQSCPATNPPIEWSNFPALNVTKGSGPNTLVYKDSKANVSTNRTALTVPGDMLTFTWDAPGMAVGPNNSYTTTLGTNVSSNATAQFALIVTQLNATYIPLTNVTNNSAMAMLPSVAAPIFNTSLANSFGVLNGTAFVAITSTNLNVSAYNLSMINSVMIAGPAILQLG